MSNASPARLERLQSARYIHNDWARAGSPSQCRHEVTVTVTLRVRLAHTYSWSVRLSGFLAAVFARHIRRKAAVDGITYFQQAQIIGVQLQCNKPESAGVELKHSSPRQQSRHGRGSARPWPGVDDLTSRLKCQWLNTCLRSDATAAQACHQTA